MLASPSSFSADSLPDGQGRRTNTSAELRYVEMKRRVTRVTGAGAFVIGSLVTASALPDLHLAGILLIFQLLQIPFNIWVNLRLLRRVGPAKGELIRNAVNLFLSLCATHLAHFPLPSWLWLPFVALAFDQMGTRFATMILLSVCVTMDGLALLEGVSWLYPVAFTLFAIFCAQIAKLRVGEMSRMLLEGDQQRRELERAHAAMTDAHHSLTRETEARQLIELELRHAQKLEVVGRLAAGIAHEINTPVQFVGDNLRFTRESFVDLVTLMETYRTALAAARSDGPLTEALAEVDAAEKSSDLPFLVVEVPRAIDKSLEGVQRIAHIVRSIKEFAQSDRKEMVALDLNEAVANVLSISRNEYAEVAAIELALSPLPAVACHAGEINQVVLNLIVNAAHAIAETPKGARGAGRIGIRTMVEPDGQYVSLCVSDDGSGIPEGMQRRVFEPFFTTKAVGKGIGQSLAVSHSVVRRHRGSLTFESKEGEGTSFCMRLPIHETLLEKREGNP